MNYCSVWNVQGLQPRTVPSKVPYVQDLLHDHDQMFMVLTETWLREHEDAELKIKGYSLFRQDRLRKRRRRSRDSGGVAIYLRKDLAADTEPVLNYSNGVVEVLGLYSKSKKLLMFAVYRQPDDIVGGNRSTAVELRQALYKIEEVITAHAEPMPDIILTGDFNLPHAVWPEGTAGPGSSKDERDMMSDLMDLAGEFFLQQLIQKPTHKKGNTLDLFLINNAHFLHSYEVTESMYSDHHIVECATLYCTGPSREHTPPAPESMRSFANLNFFSEDTDWASLDKELENQDWDAAFHGLDINAMLSHFLGICLDAAVKHVPAKQAKSGSQSRGHIPRERKNLMRRRRRVNTQLQKTISEPRRQKLKTEARDIEKKLQASYRRSRNEREHKAVSAIKRNSKYFYSYAKKFSLVKVAIGPLIDATKALITCPLKMAEILTQQYSSVFSEPREAMQKPEDIFTNNRTEGPQLYDCIFGEDDIVKAIDEISSSAAAGPDRYPALLLKNCKYNMAKPLYLLWRKSLDCGKIPQLMKMANIIPIHKGNSKGLAANYRPVALTSHLIKLFEKVLRNQMIGYMEENNLFNPGQHGFRLGRSCLSQLVAHYDNITQLLENGKNVDVVYLDFAKAFDKVDFLVTMRKLKSLGITGKLGCWIHAFLTNRHQVVMVNGHKSQPRDVKSGVPQGSVLGPLLFLVLLGDIDRDVAQAYVSSFADDTRVAKGISSEEDTQALQNDLDSIYKWSDDNNMKFNSKKFECIRYGPDNELRNTTHYTSDDGTPIMEVNHVKDLGITMSCDGTFHQHIRNITEAARSKCAWILRTFQTRDRVPMMTLWKSLIRSKLEYCCQLWHPSMKGDTQALEQVQRNFIRKISGMQQLSYWEQLQALSVYSLERRRERYLILYAWRIMEGQVPNICSPERGGISTKWHIRRGRYCVVPTVSNRVSQAVQSLRYTSFAIHAPRLFNLLPSCVRNITGCSVDSFKRQLDRYLRSVPDEPQIAGYTAMRRADSNSLIHMTQHATAQLVSTLEGTDHLSVARGGHPWSPRE